jgi:two-component system sensor histidine kinase/response regulator
VSGNWKGLSIRDPATGSAFSVVVVGDGREAVEALEIESFDLVLMDIQMPDMDGFEATDRIRARERITNTRTPIVAMTAHAMTGDREKCLAAGMEAYISKPIRRAELVEVIASVTSRSRSVAAATADSGNTSTELLTPDS